MDALAKIKTEILNPIILLLFAVAIIYFLWGTFVFIQNQDNAEAQKTGKKNMLWGIIGIFLMIAVYGIISLVANTLGVPVPEF